MGLLLNRILLLRFSSNLFLFVLSISAVRSSSTVRVRGTICTNVMGLNIGPPGKPVTFFFCFVFSHSVWLGTSVQRGRDLLLSWQQGYLLEGVSFNWWQFLACVVVRRAAVDTKANILGVDQHKNVYGNANQRLGLTQKWKSFIYLFLGPKIYIYVSFFSNFTLFKGLKLTAEIQDWVL